LVERLRTAGISVKTIVVAVIVLFCFAFLDRIPDPPTVLQNRALSSAGPSHAVPAREGARITFRLDHGWELSAPALFTILLQHDPPKPQSLSFWRAAGDSSPPSCSFFL